MENTNKQHKIAAKIQIQFCYRSVCVLNQQPHWQLVTIPICFAFLTSTSHTRTVTKFESLHTVRWRNRTEIQVKMQKIRKSWGAVQWLRSSKACSVVTNVERRRNWPFGICLYEFSKMSVISEVRENAKLWKFYYLLHSFPFQHISSQVNIYGLSHFKLHTWESIHSQTEF